MQNINISKTLDLGYDVEDLLLVSIDDNIDTINDKDGIKIEGKINVNGEVKTNEEKKTFEDSIEVDSYFSYDDLVDRNKFKISIKDFDYKVENHKVNINVILEVDGLKEIDNTFLAEESDEVLDREEVENTIDIPSEEVEPELVEETRSEVIDEPKTKSLIEIIFSNRKIKEDVSWRLHCVKQEKSYEEIANKYKVDLNKLKSLNKNEPLVDGKLIFLPLD